jgi:anhydro-N-acetylmuramic acid kinase
MSTPSSPSRADVGELYIGLMSGTSLDGVDGVLSQPAGGQWQTLAHAHRPLPPALRQALLELNTPGENELHHAALASQALAVLCAEVVQAVCELAQVLPAEVRAIGAHGQTVRHRPELGYTLQLNQPALLAELTGIDVVADCAPVTWPRAARARHWCLPSTKPSSPGPTTPWSCSTSGAWPT